MIRYRVPTEPWPPITMLTRRLLLILALAWGLQGVALSQEMRIHVIDVDQGLAVLVEGPGGINVLFDGGNPGDGSGIVRPYLQSQGISTLHYGVASHWHSDHMGGLDEVFNAGFKPTIQAYDRGDYQRPTYSEITQYLNSVANPSNLRATPPLGLAVWLGNNAEMEFVALNGDWVGGSADPGQSAQFENSSSIVCVVRFGDFELYIGGDCTGGGNSTVNVESGIGAYIGQIEAVISGHHGSNTSSNGTFVGATSPSLVLHSAGQANPYGHPTKTVTNRWNTIGYSRVQWCTSDGDTGNGSGGYISAGGHILITTDGNSFTVSRNGGTESVRFACFEQAGTTPSVGDLAITEVLVDPSVSDAYGEWFEVLNIATGELDLGGLKVESGNDWYKLASRLLLAPGERLVLGVDGKDYRNGDVFLAHGAPWETFTLANGDGSLTLSEPSGAVLETVTWGSSGFPVSTGVSAERINPFTAPDATNFSDADAAWSGTDLGSPWAAGSQETDECPTPISYCISSANSVGAGAIMGYGGSVDINANDLVLTSNFGTPNQYGIFFYGSDQAGAPFGDGFRCVGGQLFRFTPIQMDASGLATFPVDLSSPPQPTGQVLADSTWNFQFWYRDPPGGPAGYNLSDGLSITFCDSDPGGGGGGEPQPGDLVITEFLAAPSYSNDPNGEWIEIFNITTADIDMEGWAIRDNLLDYHAIDNGGAGVIVPAWDYIVLGRSQDQGQNGGVDVDYAYNFFTLDTSSDAIIIQDGQGTEIDRVDYATPFFPIAPGRSTSLDWGIVDWQLNDNPSYWCLSESAIGGGNTDTGTPGEHNDMCP
ncbi:MAG: lamin tail domain-containing protein [Planctomycetota bacterium]|nr:lamin tail domain-containing protein [Planctomycetota bacterium]